MSIDRASQANASEYTPNLLRWNTLSAAEPSLYCQQAAVCGGKPFRQSIQLRSEPAAGVTACYLDYAYRG